MKIKVKIPVLHPVDTHPLPQIRVVRATFDVKQAESDEFEKILRFNPHELEPSEPQSVYNFYSRKGTDDIFMNKPTESGATISTEDLIQTIITPAFCEAMQINPKSHSQVYFPIRFNGSETNLASPTNWFMAMPLAKRELSNTQMEQIADLKARIQISIDANFKEVDGRILAKTGEPIFALNAHGNYKIDLSMYTSQSRVIDEGNHFKNLKDDRANFETNVLLLGWSDLKKLTTLDEEKLSKLELDPELLRNIMEYHFLEYQENNTSNSILYFELYAIIRDFIKTAPTMIHESSIFDREQSKWMKNYRKRAFDMHEMLQVEHAKTSTLEDIRNLFQEKRLELEGFLQEYADFFKGLTATLNAEQKNSIAFMTYRRKYLPCKLYKKVSALVDQIEPVNISTITI